MDPFDIDALKKVSEHVDIPIAVGERLYTRYGFRPVVERHAADFLMPDVATCGGILEGKKIAAMAETCNMRIQPHNCAGPVCTAASLQLCACVTNLLMLEVYPYREVEHYALVDRPPEMDIKDSTLVIPDRPGLGVEPVEDRVASFLWATCTS